MANNSQHAKDKYKNTIRAIPAKTRREWQKILWENQNGICALCGFRLPPSCDYMPQNHPMRLSLDHILPVSRGGQAILENIRLVHRRCNEERGNKD